MRCRHLRQAVGLAVFLAGVGVLVSSSAGAQTPTFSVEGVITDEQQAVLPGASVTIRNVATNLSRTATTDETGRYVFSALPPEGRYEISGGAGRLRHSVAQ